MSTVSVPAVRSTDGELVGDLLVPDGVAGLVVFAHGSGSSRHSPRNQAVAETLRDSGFGTLLFDLLTPDEEQLRFDIELLTDRLVGVLDWLAERDSTARMCLGLFGASTGAAAALRAAAQRPVVRAVVSRGGRPDLASDQLANVRSPCLLLVGERDEQVIEFNRRAAAMLSAERRLDLIAGATHLFEEPGALEEVSTRAVRWFEHYLQPDLTKQ